MRNKALVFALAIGVCVCGFLPFYEYRRNELELRDYLSKHGEFAKVRVRHTGPASLSLQGEFESAESVVKLLNALELIEAKHLGFRTSVAFPSGTAEMLRNAQNQKVDHK